VDVEHRGVEQLPERGPAHHVGRHALDQRPRAEEIGRVGQHELVGDLRGDQRAHVLVLQRGGRAVGELLGVEQRPLGVAGKRRGQQREHRADQGDGGERGVTGAPRAHRRRTLFPGSGGRTHR
jgi:hypothetical protein